MTRAAGLALAIGVLAIGVLAISGCNQDLFTETGTVRSQGNFRNTWQSRPQGCTRDPFDGRPAGESGSVVTFLWEDPANRDPKLGRRERAPDAPMRLEFEQTPKAAPGNVVATLHTLENGGILLDSTVCSKLALQTKEQPDGHVGGRPTLSGGFELDCNANGSHITSKVDFKRCEY